MISRPYAPGARGAKAAELVPEHHRIFYHRRRWQPTATRHWGGKELTCLSSREA